MGSNDTPRLDETFSLLSNPRRRYALYYLERESDSVAVTDLAERIAMWEVDDATVSGDEVDTVQLSLLHTHLPKLEDAGVLTFATDSGTVELDDSEALSPYLDRAAQVDFESTAAADD